MLRERAILELKRVLTRIGAHLPCSTILALSKTANYMALGRWMADHGFSALNSEYVTREDFFARVANEVGDSPVLFMEFGVYRGESIRVWSRLLRHPETRLFGFDSFEGLPETFHMRRQRKFYDVGGQLPQVDDPRVPLPTIFRERGRGSNSLRRRNLSTAASFVVFRLRIVSVPAPESIGWYHDTDRRQHLVLKPERQLGLAFPEQAVEGSIDRAKSIECDVRGALEGESPM